MVFYLVYSLLRTSPPGRLDTYKKKKKKNKHTNPPMDAKRDIHTIINNGSSIPQEQRKRLPLPTNKINLLFTLSLLLSSSWRSFPFIFFFGFWVRLLLPPLPLSLFLSLSFLSLLPQLEDVLYFGCYFSSYRNCNKV